MTGGEQRNLPAVAIRDVVKVFRVYNRPRDVLYGLLTGHKTWHEHRALDGISLDIPLGQSLGIVGRNGAGKSTLLKILAGVLDPTAGSVSIAGKISAILELGVGIQPEFSGRESIIFSGLCLGLTRHEIEERFDEIVEFSGLADVLDRPVRTYSTGMQARLSFSVAASIDSEVMIVDEALSVGDARFQLKCFNRFQELQEKGTTILLVSHNMSTVIGFCDRAILIEQGRLVEDGNPQEIDRAYQKLLFHAPAVSAGPADMPAGDEAASRNLRFGNGKAKIKYVRLYDASGQETGRLQSAESFLLEFQIEVSEPIYDLVIGLLVRSPKGIDLCGIDTKSDPSAVVDASLPGLIRATVAGQMNLAQGDYFLTVGLAHADGEKIDLLYDALQLRVVGTERLYTTSLVNLLPVWTFRQVGAIQHTQSLLNTMKT